MPVSTFGQVPRDVSQKELEYFLNKQYNTIGIRLQEKLLSVEKHFSSSIQPVVNSSSAAKITSENNNQQDPTNT